MLLGSVYPPKQPSESFPIGIDFAEDLAAGETISTVVTTARRMSDLSDASSAILSGTDLIVGSVVQHRVVGGISGELYRVQMRILTSGSNSFEHEIELPVEEF